MAEQMTEQTTERTNWSTVLTVFLWFSQILLAVAFGLSGVMKVLTPMPELVETMTWAENLPAWLIRFIGASEIAGAAGLILPGVTKIKPTLLTVAAAGGLVVIMVLAALFHIWRAEFFFLPVNLFLGGVAAFVIWGRLKQRAES